MWNDNLQRRRQAVTADNCGGIRSIEAESLSAPLGARFRSDSDCRDGEAWIPDPLLRFARSGPRMTHHQMWNDNLQRRRQAVTADICEGIRSIEPESLSATSSSDAIVGCEPLW